MQTALAVRDTYFIITDILVFVIVYFVTLVLVLGSFNRWMLAPLFGWLLCYLAALKYFVPRLVSVSKAQVDARASTIAAMDRLIVVDRGRIVEEGGHRSLLARGGLYARL